MTMNRVDSPDLEAASRAAAERITSLVRRTLDEHGRFSFALTGGSTPRRLYELLAGEMRRMTPWDRVDWFWGDERCVPPDDADSNYRLAWETLLAPTAVPVHRIHRMHGELRPYLAAREYEAVLNDVVPGVTFDFVLFGMGDDGHVASLFPGHAALDETSRNVISVEGPDHLAVRDRITLTYPVINAARNVFFLVSGAKKRVIVDEIFADPEGARSRYPAARVQPAGDLTWFVG